jgi:hypothetical protein
MSMSDPFLPIPPEQTADAAAQQELRDVEEDREPDALTGTGDDAAEVAAAADADEPERFVTPRAGDRLTADELEADLG